MAAGEHRKESINKNRKTTLMTTIQMKKWHLLRQSAKRKSTTMKIPPVHGYESYDSGSTLSQP